jgi:hypothetical protein
VTLDVKSRDVSESPRFSGSFAHGSPGERFLYLSWKRQEPRCDPWAWRIKIPLDGITRPMLRGYGLAVDRRHFPAAKHAEGVGKRPAHHRSDLAGGAARLSGNASGHYFSRSTANCCRDSLEPRSRSIRYRDVMRAFRFVVTLHKNPSGQVARAAARCHLDPEFSTKQPLFTVSDWTREPVLQCKNDGRKRRSALSTYQAQTWPPFAAITFEIVLKIGVLLVVMHVNDLGPDLERHAPTVAMFRYPS